MGKGAVLTGINTSSDTVVYADVPIDSFNFLYVVEATLQSSGIRSAKLAIQNQDRSLSMILKLGEVEKSVLHGVKSLILVQKIPVPENWGKVNAVMLTYNPDATAIVTAITVIGAEK